MSEQEIVRDEHFLEMLKIRGKRMIEDHGLGAHLGLKLTELNYGSCTIEVEMGEHLYNPRQEVHGGALFTLADVAAGYAAVTLGYNVTTVNTDFQYLRAGKNTKKIICKGSVIKSGKTMVWTKADVFDQDDRHLCTGTLLYYRLAPFRLEDIQED